MKTLEILELHSLLDLDEITGFLTRKAPWILKGKVRAEAGTRIGSVNVMGYRVISINGKIYREHRIIFAMVHGRWPVHGIDHINGIKTDNRSENLREATQAQNGANRSIHSRINNTGFKGVYERYPGRFQAMIRIAGKLKRIGTFDDAETAHYAYLSHALLAHGEFARVSQ